MDSTDEEDFWDEIEVPLPPGPTAETLDVFLADALEFNIEITLPRKGVENREQRELALALAFHDICWVLTKQLR